MNRFPSARVRGGFPSLSLFLSLGLLLSLSLAACGGSGGATDPGVDGGADAAEVAGGDEGPGDPGTTDEGRVDDGPGDPGTTDEGPADAVPGDPGPVDAGPTDAGPVDPGPVDPGPAADDGPATDPGPADLPPEVTGPVTVTIPIGAAADAVASYLMDAGLGEWNLFGGADVPVGRHWDEAHVSYHTALRFPGVPVPAGATVTSARLSFQPIGPYAGTKDNLWIDLRAERVADSAPFSLSGYETGRPDQRLKTQAKVPADPPQGSPSHWLVRCNAGCTDLTEYDCPQRKLDCWDREVRVECPKDLAPLVQEVVDLPGWAAGNALTIFLLNAATDQDGANYQDHRSFTGYDPDRGLEFRPTLTITYE